MKARSYFRLSDPERAAFREAHQVFLETLSFFGDGLTTRAAAEDLTAATRIVDAAKQLQIALRPLGDPRRAPSLDLMLKECERRWQASLHENEPRRETLIASLTRALGHLRFALEPHRKPKGPVPDPRAEAWVRIAAVQWWTKTRKEPSASENSRFWLAMESFALALGAEERNLLPAPGRDAVARVLKESRAGIVMQVDASLGVLPGGDTPLE